MLGRQPFTFWSLEASGSSVITVLAWYVASCDTAPEGLLARWYYIADAYVLTCGWRSSSQWARRPLLASESCQPYGGGREV
jgi:hypothetical protein